MFKYSWVLLLVYLSLFWTCRGHVCGTVLGFFLERVAQKQTCFAVPPRKLCGWISNEERYWTKDTLVNHLRALKDLESNRQLFDFVGFHNYHSFVYFNFALKRKWCNKKVIISGGVLRLASCWLWHVSEFRLTLEGIFFSRVKSGFAMYKLERAKPASVVFFSKWTFWCKLIHWILLFLRRLFLNLTFKEGATSCHVSVGKFKKK